MIKSVSILAGLAAINGALAGPALPENHPIARAGLKDACHQNDVPEKGDDYPCNQAALHQWKCEHHDTLAKQQACVCEPWFMVNKNGCIDCKDLHGLDGPKGIVWWQDFEKNVTTGYCAEKDVKETYFHYWERNYNATGGPPSHGPGNMPENRLVGQKEVSLYFKPSIKKPDASIYPDNIPSGTVKVADRIALAVATASSSASAAGAHASSSAGVSGPLYKNGSSTVTPADVGLHDIVMPCGATYHTKTDSVTWSCGQGKVLPNPELEKMNYFELDAKVRIAIPDASFCGCVANQVSTGANVSIHGVPAIAGFTRLEKDSKTNKITASAKAEAKLIPGAGPNAEQEGTPYFAPAKKSPEDCITPAKKAGAKADAKAAAAGNAAGASAHASASAEVTDAGVNASASASASASGPGAHAKAHAEVHVTLAKAQGVDVWVPTANVKKEAAAAGPKHVSPAGKDESSPSKGSSPAAGPKGVSPSAPKGVSPSAPKGEDSSPAKGSSPYAPEEESSPAGSPAGSGASPAGSKGESAGRPVGTGFVVPQSTGAPGSIPIVSGASAMSFPALVGAAALMVAAF